MDASITASSNALNAEVMDGSSLKGAFVAMGAFLNRDACRYSACTSGDSSSRVGFLRVARLRSRCATDTLYPFDFR